MKQKTLVVVLRSGGDFSFEDVKLLSWHVLNKWKSSILPRIICLWDQADKIYKISNCEVHPLKNEYPGTWSRIALYSPEMEQFRPFLYIDLDTAIINSIEKIFDLVEDEKEFITLEDFWQPGEIATGLVWFPAENEKVRKVWQAWTSNSIRGFRMDMFIRNAIKKAKYWQQMTKTIYDFKPKTKVLLDPLPKDADLVCFHGKPRIFEAQIEWVKKYVNEYREG